MSARSARFAPAGPLRGRYVPPADKSISHRAAIFGAMCDEPVPIRNYLDSADTRSTLTALLTLGAGVEEHGDGQVTVRGVGLHAPLEATGGRLDVGNCGTLLRLLPGWLAGQPGGVWTLDGDESIRRRPVDRIAAAAARAGGDDRGARGPAAADDRARSASCRASTTRRRWSSAQVKSCLLIAGMLAAGSTSVTEARESRDHTERLLRRARVPLRHDGAKLTVSQVDELELDELTVPGDPSSAAFMIAAAILVPDSRVVVSGVGLNWTRTGFFRIAERMGAVIVGDLEPPRHRRRRRAGRRAGRRLLDARGDGGRARRGAAGDRRADAGRAAGRVRRGGDRRARGGGAARQGVRPHPRGGGRACAASARTSRRPRTASSCAATARRRAAARSTRTAITAWRCSARWPGLACPDGVTVENMDAAAVSYPGFEQDLSALLGRR